MRKPYLLNLVRYFILFLVVGLAAAAALQSPERLVTGYPELQRGLVELGGVDQQIVTANLEVRQAQDEIDGNNRTSLADRPAEKRNAIDAFWQAKKQQALTRRDDLQTQRKAKADQIGVLTANLADVSKSLRMFGLGALGGLAVLIHRYAVSGIAQIANTPDFRRNLAAIIFGGFAGLIGYGLIYTQVLTVPYLHISPKLDDTGATLLMIVICMIAGAFGDPLYRALASWIESRFHPKK